ncbi:MAG: radical SAM protein [Lachnospiraceae bacterium]|nr:radical SAM protein [Lachnospiraceae bacterium]
MKTLFPGDDNVLRVLGRQKPSPDSAVRKNRYALSFTSNGRVFLWNGLTRAILAAQAPEEEALFASFPSLDPAPDGADAPVPAAAGAHGGQADSGAGASSAEPAPEDAPAPAGVLSSPAGQALYDGYFFLPEGRSSRALYQDVLNALRLLRRDIGKTTSYTILSTMVCNARCPYCYEGGRRQYPMSMETADDIAAYIIEKSGGSEVSLSWFGGEPLLGVAAIRRILAGLNAAGVAYKSSIVTNGYLFTEALAEEAVRDWKLTRAQISLDGTEERYNRIKNYVNPVASPYRQVLRNIGLLLDAGVRVSIRLNTSPENIEDMFRLVGELGETFPGRKNLRVYAYPLHFTDSIYKGLETPPGDLPALYDGLDRLGAYIRSLGFPASGRFPNPAKFPISYCMASAYSSACAIDPSGRITHCEHCGDEWFYGNVREGITDASLYRSLMEPPLPDRCASCPFLTTCTPFRHPCPDMSPWCRWEVRRDLRANLLRQTEEQAPQTEEEEHAAC